MKFYDRENERRVLGEVLQQSRREARMTVLMGRRLRKMTIHVGTLSLDDM
ncbi:MAG: hypothetical protein IJ762_07895 [Bacteroidaceae bacterium]|nr:hypothetical protein [Bacteroidaceae bacterium]MBR1789089.1 hypothetical protein [Bacteroidaceae bacterium]